MKDSSFGKFADSVLRWEFFIVIPIYLLCFFLPTGLPGLNFLGVFGLIVFIGVAIFRRWRIGYFYRRSPIDLPIFLFSITAVNAAWLSEFSPAAVARLWVLVGCVAIYYFIIEHNGEAEMRAYITGLVIAGAIVVLAFSLIIVLNPANKLTVLQNTREFPIVIAGVLDPLSIHNEPVFWSINWESVVVTGMVTLPLLWSLIRLGHHRFLRITFILTAILLVLALAHVSGIGPVIALVISWMFIGLILRRYYLVLGVAALGGFALVSLKVRQAFVNYLLRTINLRADLWQSAIYMIRDFPLTGIGLSLSKWYTMLQGYALPNLIVYMDQPGEFLLRSTHNYYLQTWVEQGILGFVSIVAIFVFGLWCGGRALRASFGYKKSVLLGALWLFSLICVHSLWYALPSTVGAIMLWCSLGLIVAVNLPVLKQPSTLRTPREKRRGYFFAILLGLTLWLTLLSVAQINARPVFGILIALGGGITLGGYAIIRNFELESGRS